MTLFRPDRYLQDNQLTGTIPSNLSARAPLLTYFSMANNVHLTGPLPAPDSWFSLYTLDVSNTSVNGQIPSIYADLPARTGWFRLNVANTNVYGNFSFGAQSGTITASLVTTSSAAGFGGGDGGNGGALPWCLCDFADPSGSPASCTSPSTCVALAALYAAAGGDAWANNAGWSDAAAGGA